MTREEAIDIIKCLAWHTRPDEEDIEQAIKTLKPCYNPDEWCHDCKEYDQDKHCCPRFNKVIRNTVEEIKQSKTGHWIPSHLPESILDECSECGFSCGTFTFNYCPNCGARMVKSNMLEIPTGSESKET